MQYILTEEEYTALKNEGKKAKQALKDTLQDLCTQVCNLKPVKYWNNEKAKIWGCTRTIEGEWYCDECPVMKLCPYEYKKFSK